MYLTRIQLPLENALSLRLSDAYAWHQRLWEAFPGRNGQQRDFLSRIDAKAGGVQVYLLSPTEPTPPNWGDWQTKLVQPAFLDHEQYAFELRANPTVCRVVRSDDGGRRRNGQRTAIRDDPGLRDWIQRKSQCAGFALEAVTHAAPIDQYLHKPGQRRSAKHVCVDYRGRLRVTDPEAFKAAYRQGIGPAKAFGFGLLLLLPIHS